MLIAIILSVIMLSVAAPYSCPLVISKKILSQIYEYI
jgi:hypothetical protein